VNQRAETLHTSMLRTLTLLLTLCVSGGDTYTYYEFKGECPYDSVTQCPTLGKKCCKCVYDDLDEEDEKDEEILCKDWDDDGPVSSLPSYRLGDWPQIKFSLIADFGTLPSAGKLPPEMQEFECECSGLKDVPGDFFTGSVATMQKITIRRSPMASISSFQALGEFTALTSLHMVGPYFGESAGLTDVALSSFTSLHNTLTTLDFRNNLLSSIPDTTMLTKLEELDLDENEINGELRATFPQSLEYLHLSDNKITTISSLSFPEGKSLSFSMLWINDNPITAVSSTAFDQIPELFSLNMNGHHLTRLPLALAKLTKLHGLDIKPAVNDEDEPIKDFQCTCEEASLTTWYAALVEEHKDDLGLEFSGECKYGSATMSVEDFLKEEGPKCPKNEGGEQDGKGDGGGVSSAGYPIYSSPVLSFFCLVICLLVYVS